MSCQPLKCRNQNSGQKAESEGKLEKKDEFGRGPAESGQVLGEEGAKA